MARLEPTGTTSQIPIGIAYARNMGHAMTVPVEVPLLGDERHKNWAKVVDSVDQARASGWAFGGSFVATGGIQDLPMGATLHELTRYLEPAGWLTQTWQVVLGLPSIGLKGGRPHLVQLGGIRRFAEEWDLSVAVDLAGPFDPTWEAEAAIARLGERLRLLRISASAPSRAAVGRNRVACRALHAAIDGDYGLEVAIAPARLVPFPISPRVASHGARRAVDYIAERAALHARALREGISRYEGSPSTRGI